MAGYAAIAAVGMSLQRLLRLWFDEEDPVGVSGTTTRVALASTQDFESQLINERIGTPALSIFLYRIDYNKTMRAAWSGVGSHSGRAHLPLDLHYLLTAWADNAEHEHRILGRAMQALEAHPLLSGPLLHESGGWAPNENIQLILEEITTEAVMRTFDSLPVDYRLSVPYMARVARIDSSQPLEDTPVVTSAAGAVPGTEK